MKNFIFFVSILLLTLSMPEVFAICINTADNYALEILLNKPDTSYNLNLLSNAKNIAIENNKYILQSDYSPDLALILEEQTSPPSSLSIRLQIPVKAEEKNLPYLKFSSTSAKGTLNISNQEFYNRWKISCVQGIPPAQCEFVKGKTSILASFLSKNYEIVIETREELGNCKNCNGKCLSSSPSKCLNANLKDDIEQVLQYSGLISSISEFFTSYKIITSGNALITDLSSEKEISIDWQEAIKQELVRLKRLGVISISNQDIEEIAELAREGASGQNSKIVYGENKDGEKKWLYYYETKFPFLTKLENCQEFSSSNMPTGMLVFSEQKTMSVYYLIPLIITIILLVILVILVVIAKVINKARRKRRIKSIKAILS